MIRVSLSVLIVADVTKIERDGERNICIGNPDLLGCFEEDARKIISAGPSNKSYMVSYSRKE